MIFQDVAQYTKFLLFLTPNNKIRKSNQKFDIVGNSSSVLSWNNEILISDRKELFHVLKIKKRTKTGVD